MHGTIKDQTFVLTSLYSEVKNAIGTNLYVVTMTMRALTS